MAPRYVVASTGRSGSGWIAKVLTDAGLNCGHERWWNPYGIHDDDLLGDSSWMAAYDLDGYDGIVVHQTRHPLDVVRSLAGGWSRHDDYAPRRLAHLDPDPDPLVEAMRIVLGWNRQIAEHADLHWQVEMIAASDLVDLAGRLGAPISVSAAVRAIMGTPTTFNRHDSCRDLGWDDLPDVFERVELAQMCADYGYPSVPT